MKEQFRKFAHHSAQGVGSPWAFFLALVSIVIWGMLGPHFHYSDTWQLVINTATSLSTFLVVFLIQNTQNRDAKVVQLKIGRADSSYSAGPYGAGANGRSQRRRLGQLHREFQELHDHATSRLGEIEASRKKRYHR
jgi:hypothetical protein